MNILQVNHTDLMGQRFNGYDLNASLKGMGHSACQYVFQKDSADPDVRRIPDAPGLRAQITALEYRHSLPGMLLPYGKLLPKTGIFQRADVVHYHLVHNHLLAIPDFPALAAAKPSVWTWHDPWAVTGHCVHPGGCRGWESGCSPCPHLKEHFPLQKDHAGLLWEQKRQAYRQMDVDIVVASDFMWGFAKGGPLGQCFPRVHKIPFGICLEQFGRCSRAEARQRLQIPQENFVIAFRNDDNPYKGIAFIEGMLERWEGPEGVSILTVGERKLPKRLSHRFHAAELGWSNDPGRMADFYTACDVFLMPSTAEAFGLMAVEAMASSRPVVCFEGTALPSVIFVPDCGVAVPARDAGALQKAVALLREHPQERERRGELGRRYAERFYDFKDYVRRHLELYEEAVKRRAGRGTEKEGKR